MAATAAQRAECDLRLALLTIEESGIADYTQYYGGYRRGRQVEQNEFEVGEVCERSVQLSDWHDLDGPSPFRAPIPVVEQEEFSPPTACTDLTPDEVNFYEATGNEGASFDRSYRRAALVLWPRERLFAILSQGGLPVTLPYLDDLLRRWKAEGCEPHSVRRREASDLVGEMLAQWPREKHGPRGENEPSEAATMLSSLARLDDGGLIERFLTEVTAAGCYERADNVALIEALERLAPERRACMIERIVTDTAEKRFAACADLLARAASAWNVSSSFDLCHAARCFVEKLPGKTIASTTSFWERRDQVAPEFVMDLMMGLRAIDDTLAESAVQHFLAWPKRYGLDEVLVPALRTTWKAGAVKTSPALEHLRTVGLDHLRARIAQVLEPPSDWRRESSLPCKCDDCAELARFLDDPAHGAWEFKAAQGRRTHVEEIIKKARADVDTTTERRGSPHRLVCTKNQASYERRVRQRKQDLADVGLIADEHPPAKRVRISKKCLLDGIDESAG